MSKKCPHCGALLHDEATFCTECGTKQPVIEICPACHATLSEGTKFCTQCGAAIHPEAVSPSAQPQSTSNSSPNFTYTQKENSPVKHKYITIVLIVLAVICLSIGLIAYLGKGSPVSTISVKATDMANDYIRDQASAEKKYKGKHVEITGTLSHKGQFDNAQDYGLQIYNRNAAGKNFSIVIDVDKEKVSQVNKINNGDFVSASGTCVGIVEQKDPTDITIEIQSDKVNE
ncbi:zinc-ribbon domain-containing protein [Pectinatus cerevisiiphilus]|uniref:Double zinc ribbon protein n=1 Tax=Pectinatus cerevisiiphilus TaxID=86956 RepID=A0A4R3KEA0_9FIRM|nr:zinc-ribbon domain-containing protein [Pectinatus cerevisiiphilus]TCS81403.1 double zinc ribbon protein [Pectinatus cerevisiiphilus]